MRPFLLSISSCRYTTPQGRTTATYKCCPWHLQLLCHTNPTEKEGRGSQTLPQSSEKLTGRFSSSWEVGEGLGWKGDLGLWGPCLARWHMSHWRPCRGGRDRASVGVSSCVQLRCEAFCFCAPCVVATWGLRCPFLVDEDCGWRWRHWNTRRKRRQQLCWELTESCPALWNMTLCPRLCCWWGQQQRVRGRGSRAPCGTGSSMGVQHRHWAALLSGGSSHHTGCAGEWQVSSCCWALVCWERAKQNDLCTLSYK